MEDIKSIIPHIPSQNMEETVGFVIEVFGFEPSFTTDLYSELRAGNQVVGIMKAQGEPNQQSIYFRVRDVDDFWLRTRQQLEKTKVKPPFNLKYGMREIHLLIPATKTLLLIGSEIVPMPAPRTQ